MRIARNGQPAVRLISDAPKGVVIDVAELERRRVMPTAGPTDILELLDEMRRDRPW